jgi:glycosyltransferase involved in cell wall biosynthesis
MYPGPSDPDLGSFVAQLERALRERGHEIELAVLDRRGGGKRRFLELRRRVRSAGAHDVTWAHFLVPSGALALAAGGPLVVTAHGRDVRNIGAIPGIRRATARVVERASSVIAVSDYLRRELEDKLPVVRGKIEVIDSGVDLEQFSPTVTPAATLESPAFVHVGSLTERKNVVRLAEAFERLGRGSLTFVGDGPVRGRLEGRPRVRVVGRVSHAEVPGWLTAADAVCGPALIEPFGQSILEAMACSRTVVATRIGGPPEFVTPDAGVLVDPLDVDDLARALEAAASLPSPNDAARAAAASHDVRRQAERVEEVLLRAVRGPRA